MSKAAFQQTFYDWNQKLCESKPVFTADTFNLVDTQSIAFISELELNTVGQFDAPASFLTYGTEGFQAQSCPQEGALSGDVPLDVRPPQGQNLELAYYILPLGGDTPATGRLTILWPEPEEGASGATEQVWVAGRDVRITEATGTGVAGADADGSAWNVTRDGLVNQQNVELRFAQFRSGITPHLVLYFYRPVVPEAN